ncbi:NACHT domain-containing protein [Streptomyces sp. NPDC047042]|uniref:NACHT domain-containing protein n=1 Tax=Streptomyces sp. NPDC047042 TaxID=3154807 RepID=UPI0033C538B8
MAFALVAWAGLGDVDPAGAVIGGGLSLLALLLAVRAQQWQDTDVVGLADRLASEVKRQESVTWRQLLGNSDRTIDLAFTFLPTPEHNAHGAGQAGRLTEVAAYYRALRPGRLVITGAPGAGKTVMALQLMLLLLTDRESGDPVPVRLSLAAFDPARNSLDGWITAHLISVYRLRPAAAAALVENRRVLPVLDGLDEMDSDDHPGYTSYAVQAVQAMNAYADGINKGQLVVTCRSDTYASLQVLHIWAQDSARISIAPVTQEVARSFLTARAADAVRWQGVFSALQNHPTGPLAQGLSTPWRLVLAATVYEQRESSGAFTRSPSELLTPGLNSADSVRDHLLHHAFRAATQNATRNRSSYAPENVRHWLGVLARYLHNNAITGRRLGGRQLPTADLVLHELWPISGSSVAKTVHAFLTIGAFLTMAVVLFAAFPQAWIASAGTVVCAALFGAEAWVTTWPSPARVGGTHLRTRRGRRHFAAGLGLGLALGFVYGVGVGVTGGIAVGLLIGLLVGLSNSGIARSGNPRSIVRNDFLAGVLFVLTLTLIAGLIYELGTGLADGTLTGVIAGLIVGLSGNWTGSATAVMGSRLAFILIAGVVGGFTNGPMYGFFTASGCVIGMMVNFAGGLAGLRYLALLLCARRHSSIWVPWRLGNFLDWCCEAGLMRVAGMAYQFRHRELQEFLARTTT